MVRTTDMTKGRPMPLLIRFSLPLVLTGILQQLYTLCDSVIIGRLLGLEAFAVIGAAALAAWLPQSMFLGLAQGYGAVLAQLFGAGDRAGFRRAKRIAALLSLAGAAVFGAVLAIFRYPLLDIINTPPELREMTAQYLLIIFAALPVDAMFNWAGSALRAAGDSNTPFRALIVSSVTNIVLDYVLIRFFHAGVAGAALATVIAQLISVIICVTVLQLRRPEFPQPTGARVQGGLNRILTMGLPPLLRDGVISAGGLFVQSVVNSYGVALVAGMAAAGRYFTLMNMAGGALEGAVATFSGQNTGAGLHGRVRRGTATAARLALCTSVCTAILTAIFAPQLIGFITGESDGEALRLGVYALRCTSLFLPALYILCLYRAALQGMGDSVTPMLSGFAEMAMRLICVLLLPGAIGYTAACIADGTGWFAAALLIVGRYFYAIRKKAAAADD